MGDVGDAFRAIDEIQKEKRAKNLKWNTEIVQHKSGELDFKLIQHTEYHFSLIRFDGMRLEYYPSRSKASWLKPNKPPGKTFFISNIEEYIDKHFKQQ